MSSNSQQHEPEARTEEDSEDCRDSEDACQHGVVFDVGSRREPGQYRQQSRASSRDRQRVRDGEESLFEMICAMESAGDDSMKQGQHNDAAQHYSRAIACAAEQTRKHHCELARLELNHTLCHARLLQHTEKLESITSKVKDLTLQLTVCERVCA